MIQRLVLLKVDNYYNYKIMTQKKKLAHVTLMAQRIHNVADAIEQECLDCDEIWAVKHAESLREIAESFLDLK